MGKVAFVFSGQGDQFPGMGRELYENYTEASQVFALCDSVRPGTSAMCFGGTEAELKETKNTQPCLFAMELAAAKVLMAKGIRPAAVAGFSLGEVTAATVAGLFAEKTGFSLVCRRGELMQQEAEKFDTAMAAVVKLTNDQVKALCAEFSDVYPVNFNCPGQVTVSGLASQMAPFAAAVKAAGGRAIPLKVKGAFHSPFMQEASAAFTEELKKAEMQTLEISLYSNVTAQVYAGDAAQLLGSQIASPVQWEAIIRNMRSTGIDTFVEIGPGKTLTNMIKKICPEANAYSVADLATVLSEVEPC